jgi:hypothetical protein
MRFDPNNGALLPDLSRGTTDDFWLDRSGSTSVSGSIDYLMVPPAPIGSDDLIGPAGPIMLPTDSIDVVTPIDPKGPIGPAAPIDPKDPIGPVKTWVEYVRYQLRQDVRFHDGSALTAEDVVFSYKRAMESSTWSRLLSVITDIQTPDSYTVVFILTRELIFAPDEQQIWTLPIVPARVYQSDPKRFITNPVGCGPFMAQLSDSSSGPTIILSLTAFEQYYLGRPRLQYLLIRVMQDINVLIQGLVAGALHALVLPDTEDVELAKKLKSLEEKYQIIRTTRGKRRVVHLQDRSLRERLPNNYETNWNAHLWYI